MHDRVSHRARAAAVAGMLVFALALPVVAESATALLADAAPKIERNAQKEPVAKQNARVQAQTAQEPAALKKAEPASPAMKSGTGK